jgi:hypothetical protein
LLLIEKSSVVGATAIVPSPHLTTIRRPNSSVFSND